MSTARADVAVAAPERVPASRRFLLLSSKGARFFKRTLDLAVCALVAIPVIILLPVIALLIKVDSRGPVLFRQHRVGRGGHEFGMYKFRSMHADAEESLFADPELESVYVENGFKLPLEIDPRVTRIGRLLRRTSLDELPQIWNVLVGDMSVVGPRPIVAEQVAIAYRGPSGVCLLVRPGLTGLWQVSGRAQIVGRERVDLDRRYVEEWSLGTDIRILAKTIPAVVTARGAY